MRLLLGLLRGGRLGCGLLFGLRLRCGLGVGLVLRRLRIVHGPDGLGDCVGVALGDGPLQRVTGLIVLDLAFRRPVQSVRIVHRLVELRRFDRPDRGLQRLRIRLHAPGRLVRLGGGLVQTGLVGRVALDHGGSLRPNGPFERVKGLIVLHGLHVGLQRGRRGVRAEQRPIRIHGLLLGCDGGTARPTRHGDPMVLPGAVSAHAAHGQDDGHRRGHADDDALPVPSRPGRMVLDGVRCHVVLHEDAPSLCSDGIHTNHAPPYRYWPVHRLPPRVRTSRHAHTIRFRTCTPKSITSAMGAAATQPSRNRMRPWPNPYE